MSSLYFFPSFSLKLVILFGRHLAIDLSIRSDWTLLSQILLFWCGYVQRSTSILHFVETSRRWFLRWESSACIHGDQCSSLRFCYVLCKYVIDRGFPPSFKSMQIPFFALDFCGISRRMRDPFEKAASFYRERIPMGNQTLDRYHVRHWQSNKRMRRDLFFRWNLLLSIVFTTMVHVAKRIN